MGSIMTVSISDEIEGGVDGVPCKVGRTQFWWENRKERHHLAGLGTDTRCLKSNETGAIKFLLTTELQINIIPFKVIPLGNHTLPETLLPLPAAVLEVFVRKCSQLVCHDLLDAVHSSKMTTFEVEFKFREKSHGLKIRRVWGCGTTGLPILVKSSFMEMAVTGSVVMMQHPSVRNLWPDTMNPFSEPFKDLTIVLFINCLS